MKEYIVPHHVHFGNHLVFFFLKSFFNGMLEVYEGEFYIKLQWVELH